MGNWVALDIGGANIKLADGRELAESCPFPLWQHPEQLAAKLTQMLARAAGDRLAVTMTGELADCFQSKAHGVDSILAAVRTAAGSRTTRVYLTSGQFVTMNEAGVEWRRAAASNWHALARFCGRFAPHGHALLVDVGSTTTDLIGLQDGHPVNVGWTDTQRLVSGELVYTGVGRSPACCLLSRATYRGQRCRIAQELFATTRDVYLVLGQVAEDADDQNTADGRPATADFARRRLGRMLCADASEFDPADAELLAREVADAQCQLLCDAARDVITRLDGAVTAVVISGHGEFLARRMVERLELNAEIVSVATRLGSAVSRCASAHALAVLARETYGMP
jgi:probable H4MPT-linked C1 transfer pathway protein